MKVQFMSFDEDTLKRFWSKVDKRGPDDCWEWLACKNNLGYGRFQKYRASRFALMISTSIYETDKLACHHCDNPSCCNPKHLYWGNKSSNMKDCINRKAGFIDGLRRSQRINALSRKTLDPMTELAVWRMLTSGSKAATLARDLGITRMVVRRIASLEP